MPKQKKRRCTTDAHAQEMVRRFEIACGSDDDRDGGATEYSGVGNAPSLYELHYRGNVVPEGDWHDFAESMKKPLSISMRLDTSTVSGQALHRRLTASGAKLASKGAGYGPVTADIGGVAEAIS